MKKTELAKELVKLAREIKESKSKMKMKKKQSLGLEFLKALGNHHVSFDASLFGPIDAKFINPDSFSVTFKRK